MFSYVTWRVPIKKLLKKEKKKLNDLENLVIEHVVDRF